MHPKIHLLSDETINQIAAGEVVESPASVVKELTENALDAGAKKVAIEITGGGLKLVKVIDDGMGMSGEDARLCILRHATSKITKATDLFSIGTNGFRGEALASVASIAKMSIATALEGEVGTQLEIENGEIVKTKPLARKRGTTIEVRSLFYNVPARKKFQKSAAAISAEVFRMVTMLALGYPDIHFELISNGRSSIQTKALGLKARIEELLGEEFLKGSFTASFDEGPLQFSGIIGAPINTRANRLGQYLFLNGRGVICDPIYEAVKEGYGTRLAERRHPIFVLHLNVPPDLVDVNVHPQKTQVRLRKEELFREKVSQCIFDALKTETRAPAVTSGGFTPTEISFEQEVSFRFEEEGAPMQELPLETESATFLGQVGDFLLFKDEELILLNASNAAFRIRYEALSREGAKESQGLLVPFSVAFTSVESAMILTHLDAIEALGFSLKPIGKDAFMVEALPPFIAEESVQEIFREMAHDLQEFIGAKDYAEKRRDRLSVRAASAAKRKKQYLPGEAMQLYKQLKACQSPLHCPKGETTMVRLDHDEIQNLFQNPQTAKSS